MRCTCRAATGYYFLGERPSFSGNGKTDMAEYAWFVWPAGEHDRSIGRAVVLDAAPGQLGLLEVAR